MKRVVRKKSVITFAIIVSQPRFLNSRRYRIYVSNSLLLLLLFFLSSIIALSPFSHVAITHKFAGLSTIALYRRPDRRCIQKVIVERERKHKTFFVIILKTRKTEENIVEK